MPSGTGIAPPRCHPPPDGGTLRHVNNSLPGPVSEGLAHGNGSRQPDNWLSALAEPFVTILAHGNGVTALLPNIYYPSTDPNRQHTAPVFPPTRLPISIEKQTCQPFKTFIYDMQEHSHEHFRKCANFSSAEQMNTTHYGQRMTLHFALRENTNC